MVIFAWQQYRSACLLVHAPVGDLPKSSLAYARGAPDLYDLTSLKAARPHCILGRSIFDLGREEPVQLVDAGREEAFRVGAQLLERICSRDRRKSIYSTIWVSQAELVPGPEEAAGDGNMSRGIRVEGRSKLAMS